MIFAQIANSTLAVAVVFIFTSFIALCCSVCLNMNKQQKKAAEKPLGGHFTPRPNSMWLVIYECRYDVVRVSAKGDGFFAPGQEVLWNFDAVTSWVSEIKIPV